MHRFLVPPALIDNGQVTFPESEWRHLQQVLRLQPGDEVIAFDGQGHRYLITLNASGGQISSELPSLSEPNLRVHLAQGLAKGDKMDFIIQKAVELGVFTVIPLATEHAVVKIDPRDAKKHERWQRISEEACKQCGRDLVPRVSEVRSLGQLIKEWTAGPILFFYEEARKHTHTDLKTVLAEIKAPQLTDLLLVIGPEGGFSPVEAKQAVSAGWIPCSLGPRILRTETAAIAALSIIMYELADLGFSI
ncbi:MAG: 16S rRNA (uracil(1498)-N(3))-methyltransferase [Methylocystaceae bacterium]